MQENPNKLRPAVERAIEYRRLGLNPLPLVATRHGVPGSGKAPAIRWKELQKAPETLAVIEVWFAEHPEWNVGLVTGAAGKIVVVDADSAVAVDFVHARLPQTPMQVITAKGIHFYYRHPGHHIPNNVRMREMPLDVRGDGGVVATADSEHWTGHVYRPREEFTAAMLAELPPFDPKWIDDQRRFTRATAFEPSQTDPVTRAAAYIATIPGAVEGAGGSNATFRVACLLIQRFGLSVEQAYPLMLVWNATCQPPWKSADLRRKLEEALKVTASKRGHIQQTLEK